MTEIQKVIPVIFSQSDQNIETLVFKHPLAGIQIVKGTVEANEPLEDAAIRELYEESEILSTSIHSYLGLHYPSELRPNWHVFVCHTTEALKDNWTHFCSDDGGLEFKFFGTHLAEEPRYKWHQLFKAILSFIKSRY